MGLTVEAKPRRKVDLSQTFDLKRAKYIWDIEQVWLAGEDEKLYRMLKTVIKGKARKYGRLYQQLHCTTEDFESELWETAWEVIQCYDRRGDYWLYQTLLLAFSRRSKDVVRRYAPREKYVYVNGSIREVKQGRVIVQVWDEEMFDAYRQSFEREIANYNPTETLACQRAYVGQILTDGTLTDEERTLLKTMYANPDASQREMATMMGYSDHKRVSRLLKRVQDKLSKAYGDVLE